jgi:hypothetical protein
MFSFSYIFFVEEEWPRIHECTTTVPPATPSIGAVDLVWELEGWMGIPGTLSSTYNVPEESRGGTVPCKMVEPDWYKMNH